VSETSREQRLQIMLTEEELTALDDWRFARRMPSRAAAVRELLRRGLSQEGALSEDGRTRSKDFGVVDGFKTDDGDGLDGAGA
jgi:metal-responsive CopG/Arc/MetJ family transcriptional regulator